MMQSCLLSILLIRRVEISSSWYMINLWWFCHFHLLIMFLKITQHDVIAYFYYHTSYLRSLIHLLKGNANEFFRLHSISILNDKFLWKLMDSIFHLLIMFLKITQHDVIAYFYYHIAYLRPLTHLLKANANEFSRLHSIRILNYTFLWKLVYLMNWKL
jgi:hypothetical protein